jgi:hypothetical protein
MQASLKAKLIGRRQLALNGCDSDDAICAIVLAIWYPFRYKKETKHDQPPELRSGDRGPICRCARLSHSSGNASSPSSDGTSEPKTGGFFSILTAHPTQPAAAKSHKINVLWEN